MDLGWSERCPGMDGAGDCLCAYQEWMEVVDLCADLDGWSWGGLCPDLAWIDVGWSEW